MGTISYTRTHDIGLVTSAGSAIGPIQSGSFILAQGTTYAALPISPEGFLGVDIALAGQPTVTAVFHREEKPEEPILHNPMMAFWRRAVMYFESRKTLVSSKGYILRFEDYALIISDLGQSLYMLFGRHWNDSAKHKYGRKIGTPPTETPDLLALLEKYYPPIGWDLPSENKALWDCINHFIRDYYQDLVKHFEFAKFEKALSLNLQTLSQQMEYTRLCWIWFIEKFFDLKFDKDNQGFYDFRFSFTES